MEVTVNGGTNYSAVSLNYDARDVAFLQARALAATISATFTSPVYYEPHQDLARDASQALIITQANAGNVIHASDYGAIIDQNNGVASTVYGGGAPNQIVLAGDGGLSFHGFGGNVTVAAGGGNNFISLGQSGGNDAVYTSTGNDTIHAGSANATIAAGAGSNLIYVGSGNLTISSTGHDHINLGTGTTSIVVGDGGSDTVVGPSAYGGSGYNLTFVGGAEASVVRAGAGSYSITGGAGGGYFAGGSAGDNSILGGSGAATIIGGGAGDTLFGGSGGGKIVAGSGNETLGGGGANTLLLGGTGNDSIVVGRGGETVRGGLGSDTIQFTSGLGGAGVTEILQDFTSRDVIHLAGFDANAVTYALDTFTTHGSSGSFKLEDGTTVKLIGVTHLNADNFK